jgi:hypothetical protein
MMTWLMHKLSDSVLGDGKVKWNGSLSQFPVKRSFWIIQCQISQLLMYTYSLFCLKQNFLPMQWFFSVLWNFMKQEVKTSSCSSCDRNRKMVILGLPAYLLSLNSLLSQILRITLCFTSRLLFWKELEMCYHNPRTTKYEKVFRRNANGF